MRSSTTVACRAIVMLTCLIVIPLVALFGTSLPEMLASVVDQWRDGSTALGPLLDEAPPFDSSGASPAAGFSPAANTPPALSDQVAGNSPMSVSAGISGSPASPSPPAPGVSGFGVDPGAVAAVGGLQSSPVAGTGPPTGPVAAGYAAPMTSSPGGSAGPPNPFSGGGVPDPSGNREPMASMPGGNSYARQPLVPVVSPQQSPPVVSPIEMRPPEANHPGLSSSLGGQERFVQIHQRLSQLGASYYCLESWGAEQSLFRFHCRASLGAGPNLTRQFEATDRDPIEAMNRVLLDIEAWRSGQTMAP